MKQYKYTINGNKYEVTIGEVVDNIVSLEVNGELFKVEMEKEEQAPQQPIVQTIVKPTAPKAISTTVTIKAPLPGVIREVKVNVGDSITDSQTVVILEAMKMANNIDSESKGIVKEVCVQPGQTVMEGDPLVIIE